MPREKSAAEQRPHPPHSGGNAPTAPPSPHPPLDACGADESAKKDVTGALANLKEEFAYQIGKGYDPRWPDPDDAADLQQAVKKLAFPIEKFLAKRTVPGA